MVRSAGLRMHLIGGRLSGCSEIRRLQPRQAASEGFAQPLLLCVVSGFGLGDAIGRRRQTGRPQKAKIPRDTRKRGNRIEGAFCKVISPAAALSPMRADPVGGRCR